MNRRSLLKYGIASLGTAWALDKAGAQTRSICLSSPTPRQPEGPFYPVVDQVDTDADLILGKGKTEPARGRIVIVEGVVIDQTCAPVPGTLVEIWQACETGRYNHPSDPNTAELDPNFQYWGKAVTDESGFYRFRTILPGAYPAGPGWVRPPHIHFKVSKLGFRELITQMYFAGEELNDEDLILLDLPEAERENVVVEFTETSGLPHPVGVFPIQIQRIQNSRGS